MTVPPGIRHKRREAKTARRRRRLSKPSARNHRGYVSRAAHRNGLWHVGFENVKRIALTIKHYLAEPQPKADTPAARRDALERSRARRDGLGATRATLAKHRRERKMTELGRNE